MITKQYFRIFRQTEPGIRLSPKLFPLLGTALQVGSRGVINMSRRLVVAGRRAVIRVRVQTMGPAVVHLGSVGGVLVVKKKGACRVCDACWKSGFLVVKKTMLVACAMLVDVR
jgi:hypothetical protein